MARGQKPKGDGGEDEILRQLRARSDNGRGLSSRPIDGGLLSMVVAAVSAKGAAIQFGTTKDGSRYTLKVWYKGYPTSDYAESVEELEARLAWTLDVFLPKTSEWDEWRRYAEDFK